MNKVKILNPRQGTSNLDINIVKLKDGRRGICRTSRTQIKWAKRNNLSIVIVMEDGSGHMVPATMIREIED